MNSYIVEVSAEGIYVNTQLLSREGMTHSYKAVSYFRLRKKWAQAVLDQTGTWVWGNPSSPTVTHPVWRTSFDVSADHPAMWTDPVDLRRGRFH